MNLSLNADNLSTYVSKQVNNVFCDGHDVSRSDILSHMGETLDRVEYCFSKVRNKYFFKDGESQFNHLHGDQYAMFIYFLSNTVFRRGGDEKICSKLFLLNKMLHGVDAFYEVSLPDIFLFIHPLGTVLGRANYSDYLLVYQRCGIGSNHDVFPTLGKHLSLHPGSAILGKSVIGDNCKIAAESLVIDLALENDTQYIGNPKQYTLITKKDISQFWTT